MAIIIVFIGLFYWIQSSSNLNSSLIAANDQKALEAGAVKVSKTAKKVDGMVNQWDITVKVEGKDQIPPPSTDIVLIVDTSGSMKDNSRMDKAKEAAKNFVDEILQEDYKNKIALVSFGSEVKSYSYASGNFATFSDKDSLNSTIDQLTPNGGTYTQAALSTAESLISESEAECRYIVLISDGVPTYSLKPKSEYTQADKMTYDLVKDGNTYYQTTKDIPKDGFEVALADNGNRVGNGGSYHIRGGSIFGQDWYHNHAHSAIAQANIIRNEKLDGGQPLINELYTIGVDLDLAETEEEIKVGNDTMKEIASSPEKCFSVGSDELTSILKRIAGEIIGTLKSAVVVDPMGKGFVLDGEATVTQGTATVTTGDTIQWVMGALETEDLEQDPKGNIKYAEMTYRVSATNDVLAAGVIDKDGLAATNGLTRIEYIDSKDKTQSKEFEVPSVKPIIVTLNKELLDINGEVIQPKDTAFDFEVGNDSYTQEDRFTLYPGESTQWVHPWKEGSEYTIEENISEDEYEVKININGATTEAKTAKFKFQLVNDEYEHKKIVVQNRQLPSFKTAWLNIRQSVINSHEELVIPSKGYYKMINEGTVGQESRLISGSTDVDSADQVTQELFTRYQYNLNKENLQVTINDLIPEYYAIFGHIVTPTDNNLGATHLSTNKNDLIETNDISLDYQTENEYWVTVFITPQLGNKTDGTKEDSPRPYSWSYKTNRFSN